jgi:peptidase E
MATRQIIALGGGGFSMETTPLLDDFILSRARRAKPRICFVPTASGDAATYVARFYRAFVTRECVPTDLTLFEGMLPRQPADTSDLEEFVAEQDILYVGGGNTVNAIALWRAHGLDRAFRTAWEHGTILCGVSAGMICWFAAGLTDSYGDLAPLREGLAILPYSGCPHYDGDPRRRPQFHAAIATGMQAGYAADDSAALCFDGESLREVVSSRREAAGYRVELRDGVVVEDRLPSRYLG